MDRCLQLCRNDVTPIQAAAIEVEITNRSGLKETCCEKKNRLFTVIVWMPKDGNFE
jgi:hypothetical protein